MKTRKFLVATIGLMAILGLVACGGRDNNGNGDNGYEGNGREENVSMTNPTHVHIDIIWELGLDSMGAGSQLVILQDGVAIASLDIVNYLAGLDGFDIGPEDTFMDDHFNVFVPITIFVDAGFEVRFENGRVYINGIPGNSSHFDSMVLLAEALDEFFVNIADPPDWSLATRGSHAILVNFGGHSQPGILAGKWSYDTEKYGTSMGEDLAYVERLFFVHNGAVAHVDYWGMSVSRYSRRLAVQTGINGQGMSLAAVSPMTVVDGELRPAIHIATIIYERREDGYGVTPSVPEGNRYFISHYVGHFFDRDFEQDQNITHEEFHGLMVHHGIDELVFNLWHMPDDTQEILSHLNR